MALAVIGSGFGRTGTMSLKNALEQLGFGPCHHMEEVFRQPEQVPHWQAVAAGRTVDWNEVFAGYASQVDWPGAHVWRELAAVFPQSKVVHSVRPEESWWNSFSLTIGKFFATYRQMPLPTHVHAMADAGMEMIGHQTFGGNFADRENAQAAYRHRTEQVRAAIAPERLLVFDVAEGWEPLCRFLGVPVPDSPFPHRNKTAEFWELVSGGAN
jgi:Sulfotransferase domain